MTPVRVSTTVEPRGVKCAIVFVPLRSGRLLYIRNLRRSVKRGRAGAVPLVSCSFASRTNGSTEKKKSMAATGVKQVCPFFLNVVFTASAVNCQGLCCLY